jgi:hypothetical protein
MGFYLEMGRSTVLPEQQNLQNDYVWMDESIPAVSTLC